MNVNIKVSMSDGQRNALHRAITRKDTKALATRKQVNQFVQGCIDAVCGELDAGDTTVSVNPREEKFIEIMRANGRDESYIRGALQVTRHYGITSPRPPY